MTRSSTIAILCLAAACARHDGRSPPVNNVTTPEFETRIEIATPAGEHADYVVADLDGDQNLDMAIVGLSGELQVVLGSGTVFTPGQTLQIGGLPIWIAGGDVDRDGDRDLAVVRTEAHEVTVLFNDGNAQFTVGPSMAIGDEGLSVVIADANADDLPDIVVARPSSPEILVFQGDGQGGFVAGPAIALPGGGVPFTIALGDVTRDGFADLVVSDSANDRVLVYAGETVLDFDPVPTELAVSGTPKACSLGDLTGDGFADIAVSAFDAGQFVVITDFPVGQTGPVAYTSLTVPVEGPPSLSVIGDVTGDGLGDLVGCVLGRASMVVVPQLPRGGLGQPFQLDATGLPLRPFLGDADRNGRTDLFVLAGLGDHVNLWLARSNGELVGARNWDVGLVTSGYAVAGDFNRDGEQEVVVGNNYDTRIVVMKRTAAGRMEPVASIELGRNVFNVRKVDLDRDGLPDLVVPVDNGVKVLRNMSTPAAIAFEVVPAAGIPSFGTGVGLFGVAVADLDRDGRADLVVADFAAGQLIVLHGSADPFRFPGTPHVMSIGGGPVDVVAADFTGDGIVDVAVSRALQSDIQVYANDGHASLSHFVTLPVGQAPNYLLANDFDRDGRSDLVVSNGTSASVSLLFGDDQGFTSEDYPAGQTPTALLADDVTGDGFPDVLVASLVGGDFRVLVNDGHGGFGNVFPFPGVLGASSAVLADIDADGDADLAIASLTTNRLSIVLSTIR
jgi:hypothetical protein